MTSINVRDLITSLGALPIPEFEGQILEVPFRRRILPSTNKGTERNSAMLPLITLVAVQYVNGTYRWLEWEVLKALV